MDRPSRPRPVLWLSTLLACACGGPAGTHITGAELADYEGARPTFHPTARIEERPRAPEPETAPDRAPPPTVAEVSRRGAREDRRAAADRPDRGRRDEAAPRARAPDGPSEEARALTEALLAHRRANPRRLLDHVDDLLARARLRHDAERMLDEQALAEAQRRVRAADADVRHFIDVVRPQRLREADLDLRARLNDMLEQREEMAYLELTYADLDEAASEVVLDRQRRRLVLAEDEYILAEERFAVLRDVELPRELEELEALATQRRVERDAVETRTAERALARRSEREALQLDRLALEQQIARGGDAPRAGAAAGAARAATEEAARVGLDPDAGEAAPGAPVEDVADGPAVELAPARDDAGTGGEAAPRADDDVAPPAGDELAPDPADGAAGEASAPPAADADAAASAPEAGEAPPAPPSAAPAPPRAADPIVPVLRPLDRVDG